MNQNKHQPSEGFSRRSFLQALAATGGGLALGGGAVTRAGVAKPESASGSAGRPPNILFLLTDQQHHHSVGALGNPHLHTPWMDSLVREGVTVENSYCTNPVCMPSRSSLMTGRMPTETGVWVNTVHQDSRGRLPSDMPNLGGWLQERAGYDSVYAGKEHLPQSNTYNVQGFRVIGAGADHRGDLGDMQVSRVCEAYLRGRKEQADPFFLICSLVQPHDICHWLSLNQNALEQPWYPDMARVAPVPPVPHNFEPPPDEPTAVRALRESQQPHQGGWGPEQWRYYLWNYYRQVEMVDAEIGRVLTALEESGLADDTLVVLTSDHGEGMGEQQMVRKGYLYDSASRVPLVARLPGRIPGGRKLTRTLATGLDWMPTLSSYAGVEAPEGLSHARNLRDSFEGRNEGPLRDAVVIEDNSPGRKKKDVQFVGRKVRSPRFSYITYFNEPERDQLFDLESDPGETRNVVGEAWFKGVVEEHRNLLREWESELVVNKNAPASPWG